MSVYIDLTEFLNHPLLSGIQRVTAQLCRHWPNDNLIPVRLTSSGHLTELDVGLLNAIALFFESGDDSELCLFQTQRRVEGPPFKLQRSDVVLVPELFYEAERVAFYGNLDKSELDHYRFIIYDLIPLVHPEYFPIDIPMDVIGGYFKMVRRVRHRGFISKATQHDFCRRLLRSDAITGSVFRLGSDGLGPPPIGPRFERPLTFTMIGRLQPSKRPDVVIEAFETLFPRYPGLKLVLLGKVGHIETELARRIASMSGDSLSGLVHLSEPTDEDLRKYIDESRATIFVSGAEGFGLPPVESLWRATPVIISGGIPSVETIGSAGLHAVDPLTVENLRAAIVSFLDASYAKRKVEEALRLNLPTWRSFAREVSDWCTAMS